MSVKRKFFLHGRRIALEVVNALFGNNIVFKLIGFFNKRLGFLESIFLVYPAERRYADAFVYPARARVIKWKPWFTGLMFQNGKLMLMFAMSASDDDILAAPNHQLKSVFEEMGALQKLLCAKQKSFAGILPGVLFNRNIVVDTPEADLTARIVVQAVDLVSLSERLSPGVPIIVLGGNGFIGSRVAQALRDNNRTVCTIDKSNKSDWPTIWEGSRVVLVNITSKHELNKYVDALWPGMVILNEVYPEPSKGALAKIRERDCTCYHIVGVEAVAVPPFPAAYEGAIPCCAAWNAERARAHIRKLI